LQQDVANHVHDVREDVLVKVRDLNQNPRINNNQKLAALQEIQTETEREVLASLGPEAFRGYTKGTYGNWIYQIVR
jgi:hypothetical protein